MTKVQVDPVLSSKLHNLNEGLELCDESGRTVGYFLTVADYENIFYEMAKSFATEEELDRISQEPGGKTTAEVLASLERL